MICECSHERPRLAQLAVYVGAGVQPGQDVTIFVSDVEPAPIMSE